MKRLVCLVLALSSCTPFSPFETDEERADRLYKNAKSRLASGEEAARARELLDEAIELDPERPEFYLARASTGRILKLPQETESDFTQAITLLGPDPQGRAELARAHLDRAIVRAEAGRLPEAEEDFAEALRLLPTWVEAYLYRSQWRRRAGRAREADEDLERARQAGAALADTYYNEGVRQLNKAQLDEAERLFALAADLDPRHVRAWVALARCAMERGHYATAASAFTSAIALQPQSAELLYLRGNAYRAQERWEEAFADAIGSLDRDPRSPLTYVLRGVIYRQYQKDPENAERDFTQALELDPGLPEAYLERGILYHGMKLLNDAERDLRQSLSRRATPEAVIALGRVLRDKGQADKAAEAYRKALEVYPDPIVQKTLKDELERVLQSKEPER
ncbi:MAG TPA: tetratricopeptide repeat protein [Planctomycetota bacterium]|nr:tetratricopeptide repeat protein [Planctomycetota bacterium]